VFFDSARTNSRKTTTMAAIASFLNAGFSVVLKMVRSDSYERARRKPENAIGTNQIPRHATLFSVFANPCRVSRNKTKNARRTRSANTICLICLCVFLQTSNGVLYVMYNIENTKRDAQLLCQNVFITLKNTSILLLYEYLDILYGAKLWKSV